MMGNYSYGVIVIEGSYFAIDVPIKDSDTGLDVPIVLVTLQVKVPSLYVLSFFRMFFCYLFQG